MTDGMFCVQFQRRDCSELGTVRNWVEHCTVFSAPSGSLINCDYETRARGYKTFFMFNSFEHEIVNAHKYKNIKKFGLFLAQISLECYFSRSLMLKCQHLLAF